METVLLDIAANRLSSGARTSAGTRRWEVLWLACLVQAQGSPVDLKFVSNALTLCGQRSPLDRTGLRRVIHGAEGLVDKVLGQGCFSTRFRFVPRTMTTGPWWFERPTDEVWRVADGGERLFRLHPDGTHPLGLASAGTAPSAAPQSPTACVVSHQDVTEVFSVLEKVYTADSLTTLGKLGPAADLLASVLALRGISTEMRCVVQLRLARVLKRRGDYDEALELAKTAERLSRSPDFRDPGLTDVARHLVRRIGYDRRPSASLDSMEGPNLYMRNVTVDPRAICEAENLASLVLRRRGMELAAESDTSSARPWLRSSWNLCQSSLYWATSMRDHENAQNFVFNAGLILASMHEVGEIPTLEPVVKAYLLGLLLRDNFDLGQDSVWDHIFIANLWLANPESRESFEEVLGLERESLAAPDFYISTLRRAEEIGEERQIALCCVNLWRLADALTESARTLEFKQMAEQRVRTLLHGRGELKRSLIQDQGEYLRRMLKDGS